MRELLISLAVRYNGDYFAIRRALKDHEEAETIEMDAVTIADEDYPKELLQLRYPPYVLFYKGNRKLLEKRKIAVVGSRNMTTYGEQVTEEIVRALNNTFVTVSGMARGIDAVVHKHSRHSIGVLGCGLDVHYPLENEDLYREMAEHQLLITEYPPGVKPLRRHFPFRNRIIAALGEGVIVTQAALRSGTMLTVNEALDLGKEVYTVPYRLTDSEGAGCNSLLQQGANIILNGQNDKIIDKWENIDKN